MAKKINFAELSFMKELSPLFKLRFRKRLAKSIPKDAKILIIDTCLVGDFMATVPALTSFLKKHNVRADIVVTSAMKPLAEHIQGIDNVFTAKSSYARGIEKSGSKQGLAKEYDVLLLLRISPDAYRLIKGIRFGKMLTYDTHYIRFFFHIFHRMMLHKKVKQWRDVNFEILSMPKKIIPFEEMFDFTAKDFAFIRKIPCMSGKRKKIIIHTGSGWDAKLWTDDQWVELICKLNTLGRYDFIFVGATETERKSFAHISSRLDFKVYSLIDKVDLWQTALIMAKSDYFIGIDSGPRNVAHAVDLRSISMLGPGIKDFMPPNRKDIVIDHSEKTATSVYYRRYTGMDRTRADEVVSAFKRLKK